MDKKTYWYVEPIGSQTNKVIAANLSDYSGDVAENKVEFLVAGKKVKAFEVPYDFIKHLNKSRSDFNLSYRVYKKQGKNSQVQQFDFHMLNNLPYNKAMKRKKKAKTRKEPKKRNKNKV